LVVYFGLNFGMLGLVYLDHAGSTLYSELQMEAVFSELTTNVYGNPHSQSDSSSATCDILREARQQVLYVILAAFNTLISAHKVL
jgi:cysteine sulfinate desulfinase/cysteine desulfurase-like protein